MVLQPPPTRKSSRRPLLPLGRSRCKSFLEFGLAALVQLCLCEIRPSVHQTPIEERQLTPVAVATFLRVGHDFDDAFGLTAVVPVLTAARATATYS